jgi:nitric oxide reductase activation protein
MREAQNDKAPPAEGTPQQDGGAGTGRARLHQVTGTPVAQYPEWDYAIRQERPDWTTVLEGEPPLGDPLELRRLTELDRPVAQRLTAVIRAAKIDRPALQRRQAEGEFIDLDAAIRAAVDRRTGVPHETRVYARSVRRSRSLSSLLLVDASDSTNDPLPEAAGTLFDLQRRAVALFAHSVHQLGDAFAIRAFSSDGRHKVHYARIKEAEGAYDAEAQARLMGIRPGLSTRLGAALRHAGQELAEARAQHRLLLVVSDGEPSDIDVADRRYLVEDARHAVTALRREGIHVVCLSVDPEHDDSLYAVFGRHHVVHLRRLARLPLELSLVYLRLTR